MMQGEDTLRFSTLCPLAVIFNSFFFFVCFQWSVIFAFDGDLQVSLNVNQLCYE